MMASLARVLQRAGAVAAAAAPHRTAPVRSLRTTMMVRTKMSPRQNLSTTATTLRTTSTRDHSVGDDDMMPPPLEPHKQRPAEHEHDHDLNVGEIEGASFRVEPLRRVGEDEGTMRARLVYQSRKRGTLESDLLLSTFADRYLPDMTQNQMAEYDRFLDENDWDIYYWATQEPPPPTATTTTTTPSTSSPSSTSSTSSTSSPSSPSSPSSSKTTPTSASASASETTSETAEMNSSSATYGWAPEPEPESAATHTTSSSAAHDHDHAHATTSEPISTGGLPLDGDLTWSKDDIDDGGVVPLDDEDFLPHPHPASEDDVDADVDAPAHGVGGGSNAAAAAAAASEEPYRKPGEGEWAQTVGTFKPAYRPVPIRWRDSEILKLLRWHVKTRSGEGGGGMGFMPGLKH
ncbi:DUF339-domain-containing protein [Xylariomycetidae sp. FL2044]|nr:DUF339-domain-containing protein [Xylariomycetidae sp. FL2044]